MSKPHTIVRLKDLGRYLPLGKTQRAEIIRKHLIKTVPISSDGRARGVTLDEIMRYQKEVMGLDPIHDNMPGMTASGSESTKTPLTSS